MPILKSEPAGVVNTLEELFALAHNMETEAAARYAAFADAMREQGEGGLADVFDRIAAEERSHVESVEHWSEKQAGRRPDPSLVKWHGPPAFEEEDAAEMLGSDLLTPYRVLSIAVRNEERAFAFWSYVAAEAGREDVRRAAETMAREELGHVAAFRRERRKAFHAEKRPAGGHKPLEDVARLEDRLANLLGGEQDETDLARLAAVRKETRGMAEAARDLGLRAAAEPDASPAALCEILADAYLTAADHASIQEELEAIQHLAERAISRLTAVRALKLQGGKKATT